MPAMGTNNESVITSLSSADKARDLLDHAALIEDAFGDLLPEAERSKNAHIAALNNELGVALKLAHIHATLAVAEALKLQITPRTTYLIGGAQ